MKIIIIEVTCEDKEDAERLADILLAKKLIECANINSGVNSLYRLKDKIENKREAILCLKTVKDKTNDIVEVIKKEHGYEAPAIIKIEAESLDEGYS